MTKLQNLLLGVKGKLNFAWAKIPAKTQKWVVLASSLVIMGLVVVVVNLIAGGKLPETGGPTIIDQNKVMVGVFPRAQVRCDFGAPMAYIAWNPIANEVQDDTIKYQVIITYQTSPSGPEQSWTADVPLASYGALAPYFFGDAMGRMPDPINGATYGIRVKYLATGQYTDLLKGVFDCSGIGAYPATIPAPIVNITCNYYQINNTYYPSAEVSLPSNYPLPVIDNIRTNGYVVGVSDDPNYLHNIWLDYIRDYSSTGRIHESFMGFVGQSMQPVTPGKTYYIRAYFPALKEYSLPAVGIAPTCYMPPEPKLTFECKSGSPTMMVSYDLGKLPIQATQIIVTDASGNDWTASNYSTINSTGTTVRFPDDFRDKTGQKPTFKLGSQYKARVYFMDSKTYSAYVQGAAPASICGNVTPTPTVSLPITIKLSSTAVCEPNALTASQASQIAMRWTSSVSDSGLMYNALISTDENFSKSATWLTSVKANQKNGLATLYSANAPLKFIRVIAPIYQGNVIVEDAISYSSADTITATGLLPTYNMPDLVPGTTYYTKVITTKGTSYVYKSVALDCTPLKAPSVCANAAGGLNVSWDARTNYGKGYSIEIDNDPSFVSPYWTKYNANNADLDAVAPKDTDGISFANQLRQVMPNVVKGASYYVRIKYEDGRYSQVARVMIAPGGYCASLPPTSTPTPTVTPTVVNSVIKVDSLKCYNGSPSIYTSWQEIPVGETIGWMDFAYDASFPETASWHKQIQLNNKQARIPTDYDDVKFTSRNPDLVPGNQTLNSILTPGIYYMRFWYTNSGTFSPVTKYIFTAAADCPVVITPTPTNVPIAKPSLTAVCTATGPGLSITWSGRTGYTGINWVQVADEATFADPWSKGTSNSDLNAIAPRDGGGSSMPFMNSKGTMPNITEGKMYYVRIKYEDGRYSDVAQYMLPYADPGPFCPTPTVTPSISNTITPTATPTPIAIAMPGVSGNCYSKPGTLLIGVNWVDNGMGANGYWIDISKDPTFSGVYWHKGKNPGEYQARIPVDIDGNSFFQNNVEPKVYLNTPLEAGTYYIRVWYAATGKFSEVASIDLPAGTCDGLFPAPTNLLPSGTVVEGTKDITWVGNTQTVDYEFRVDDLNNAWGTCGKIPVGGLDGDICEKTTVSKYTYPFVAGHKYKIWVHSNYKVNNRTFVSDATVSYVTAVKVGETITPTPTATPINTPSVTPTTVNPTPAIAAPVVATSCVNGQAKINISWVDGGYGTNGYWADITDQANFSDRTRVWNNYNARYDLTAVAPTDFGLIDYGTPMPDLTAGKTYYVRLWYNQPSAYTPIVSIVAPTCAGPTATPTPVLTAPTVNATCLNGVITLGISWAEAGLGSEGYWIDVSNDSTFTGLFWHNSNPTGDLTSTAPVDSDGYYTEYYTGTLMPAVPANSNYYARVWYNQGRRFSPVATVKTPTTCAVVVPTNTTVPTSTAVPTVRPTNTTVPTARPTSTPVINQPTSTPVTNNPTSTPAVIVTGTVYPTELYGTVTPTVDQTVNPTPSTSGTVTPTVTPTDEVGDIGKIFGSNLGPLSKLSFLDCGSILLIVFGAIMIIFGSLGMFRKYAVQDLPLSEASGQVVTIMLGLFMVVVGVILVLM